MKKQYSKPFVEIADLEIYTYMNTLSKPKDEDMSEQDEDDEEAGAKELGGYDDFYDDYYDY